MWLIVVRAPKADVVVWPGRRWLAAIDAVAWPCMWIWLMHRMPTSGGLLGAVVEVSAVIWALHRLHCAVLLNHRYRFTSWRWGKVAAALLIAAEVLKFLLPV